MNRRALRERGPAPPISAAWRSKGDRLARRDERVGETVEDDQLTAARREGRQAAACRVVDKGPSRAATTGM
jgi:hypothetical protein